MKKRQEDHISNEGEQIQELEDKIRKELERLGMIEVSFNYEEFNDKNYPRFSYRLKKGFKNPKKCPLAERLKTRILRNFSNYIFDIISGEDIKTINERMIVFYTETLMMTPEKIREAYKFKKSLLTYFFSELMNYKMCNETLHNKRYLSTK